MKQLKILSPIHKATRQIEIHLSDQIKEWGFNSGEAHLLTYLLGYAPCPISELHRVFGLKRSTLTSMLDRLEARGLIARSVLPEDRRSWVVSLESKGRSAAKKIRQVLETFESRLIKKLNPDEIVTFHRVMEAIADLTGVEVKDQRRPAK
ncbi:MAG: MarR family winged helix-turn-helix transcriptional regulator [Planctomycetota bacterium]|jgi:DNA-binding MarR family transcriptional regulator